MSKYPNAEFKNRYAKYDASEKGKARIARARLKAKQKRQLEAIRKRFLAALEREGKLTLIEDTVTINT